MRARFGACLALYGCLLALLAWLGTKSGAGAVPATLLVGGAAGLLCVEHPKILPQTSSQDSHT